MVNVGRLAQLWNDPERAPQFHYDPKLHLIFLRLMERFDISYKVTLPPEANQNLGVEDRMSNVRTGSVRPQPTNVQIHTSLIAQLVPDIRPEKELSRIWPEVLSDGDEQKIQICRIVDARNGQSAPAEGLFYQLIVRLHRFSLGRTNYDRSIHWQRGLILDDDYNGRALLEHIGNDVRITVVAASTIE